MISRYHQRRNHYEEYCFSPSLLLLLPFLRTLPWQNLEITPQRHHQAPTTEEKVAHLTEILSLSDSQSEQITEILDSLEAEQLALKEQFESLREQEQEAINAVLSEEQQELMSSQRPKGPHHH